MAGISITMLGNKRLKCNLNGYSPSFLSICPYVTTLRFRKRVDNLTIDVAYDDGTTFQVCAHTDAPIAGVIPVEFVNDVEMTSQTMLYDTLAAL